MLTKVTDESVLNAARNPCSAIPHWFRYKKTKLLKNNNNYYN